MLRTIVASEYPVLRSGRRTLCFPLSRTAVATSILSLAALAGLTIGTDGPSATATSHVAAAQTPQAVPAVHAAFARLFDPRPELEPEGRTLWSNAPLPAALRLSYAPRVASVEPAAEPSGPLAQALATDAIRTAQIPPLPVPRPAELGGSASSGLPRVAGRQPSRRTRNAAVQAPEPDNRSFFEKLFGLPAASAPAVNYAALDNGLLPAASPPKLSPAPIPSAGAGIATYDISARVVTLPSGERLEAHSGLGDKLDDPRHVRVRMRGATPPGTYELTEREQLFHGVRALRLNPVGGSGAVHGRAGLLAHTFMLGPNGDSNGCVSFRDYERFLQVYLRGEIRQLVVVAGSRQDGLPNLFNRRFGGPERPVANGRDA